MENKNWLEEIKKFKKEMESEKEFSPREKEILLGAYAEKLIFEKFKKSEKVNQLISDNSEKKEKILNIPDSFASLINEVQVNQHTDYVLLAVYYLVIKKGFESVTVKDITNEYKKAYLKPSNTNVYLVNLTRRGFLMPVEKKEGKIAFTITRGGIKSVEDLFENEHE